LFNYHQLVLELTEESNWRLIPIEEYGINNRELITLPETQLPTVLEMKPEPLKAQDADLTSLKIEELRKLCKEKGIKWRNARGTGKHLTKGEMLTILMES